MSFGCSTKAPLILRPAPADQVVASANCRARAQLQLQDKNQSLNARTDLRFAIQDNKARLLARFYSPFGTQVGQLQIDDNAATWRDAHGEVDIRQQPLFGKWYRSSWWSEVAFLMGLVVEKTRSSTQVDDSGRPRLLKFSDRSLRCDYSGSRGEKSCKIEGIDFSGSLNFRILECL